VKSGSEVRARVKLLDVTEKGQGRLLIKTEVTLEINGDDKPALIAETLTMAVTAG
jgi:acyl dehydratase